MIDESSWRKSSYSSGDPNNCVEVAVTTTTVSVRDTKDRTAGRLDVAPGNWSAFLLKVADPAS